MYRCVRVSNPDNYLQCVLWRNDPAENIGVYKLDTVTYGTKPAAFLAIRAMHELSYDEEESYPLAAKIVRRDFYVDDLITGGNSVEEVLEIRRQVTELLSRRKFDIRTWCSNEAGVLAGVSPIECEQFLKFHDGTDITKALGLVWDPKADTLIFTFMPTQESSVVTKRTVLSCIARLYDPLGLIGPLISRAKVIMQTLWKHNLQWDESLPQSLHTAWSQFVSQFTNLHKFIFPRFVSVPNSTIQIHAFCDASLSAYGACVYVRSECNGKVTARLLCSKSRVAPLKVMTVPKLELSAAALLADLLDGLSKVLPNDLEYHCWSDSMVVLSWIREQPSNFNVFVSNRACHLELVQDLSTPSFLAALKRFICIRGKPRIIWSDNATNFVGAKNELIELKELFFSQSSVEAVLKQCLDDGIEWKFIPPRSPHFGGLWEAAVKAAKYHFYRVAGLSLLSFEELRTLVCQISAILNSRPLCPLTENPDDLDILTPGHFLVVAPLVSIMEPDVTELNINTLNRWQRVSYMQQIFWKKWSSSYLSQLQERNKWRAAAANVKDGDLVMLRDENMPPLKWQLGRVSATIAGKDGVVRVAIIKTTNGTCRRAVTKLAVLPIEKESVESLELPTGGG
ncbi:uncharacterized protein [Musca autumnalis]|uniref:uncharacterized protein n=1 Tax=Musca autumnalis TaxID=221902 RepID=UPI003CE81C85